MNNLEILNTNLNSICDKATDNCISELKDIVLYDEKTKFANLHMLIDYLTKNFKAEEVTSSIVCLNKIENLIELDKKINLNFRFNSVRELLDYYCNVTEKTVNTNKRVKEEYVNDTLKIYGKEFKQYYKVQKDGEILKVITK